MPAYIEFECECGRTLRVKREQGGTVVRCWNCQAEVLVPRTRTGASLARESLRSARAALAVERFKWIVLGAIVLTCALATPIIGLLLGVGLILAISPLYSRAIEQGGLQGTPASAVVFPRSRRATRLRRIISIVAAAGLLAPLLLRHLVMDGTGYLLGIGGAGVAYVSLICWLVLPLLLLGFSACDRAGALGFREALRAMHKHPLATACALLVLPFGLTIIELVMIACTWLVGWFGALVTDFFPILGTHSNTVVFNRLDSFSPNLSFDTSWWYYSEGFHKGYTLSGAIPASLPRGVHTRISKEQLGLDLRLYLAIRMIFSCLILTSVGSVLAIQSRWLGLIPSIDSKRTSQSTST